LGELPMIAPLPKLGWFVIGLLVCTGCRSQLGSVYGVATGRTTAEELLPPRAGGAARPVSQASATEPAVSQTSFAPPPVGAPPVVADSGAATPLAGNVMRQNPLAEPTRDEAFAAVLGDIRQLGAENPAALQDLLKQLDTTEPGHWQSLVKRYKADLAMHRQLKQGPAHELPIAHAAHSTPSMGHSTGHSTAHAAPAIEQAQPAGVPETKPAHSHEAPPAQQPIPSTYPVTNASATLEVSPGVTVTAVEPPAANVRLASAAEPIGSAGPNQAHMPEAGEHEPPHAQLREPAPRHWQASLREAIASLEIQTQSQPLSTSEAYRHARLRLLLLAADDLDGAVAPVPGLSPTEQDYWSKQMFAVATMLDQHSQPETTRRAAAAGMHLAKAYGQLQQMGSLAVRNLTFCESVTAYGSYEPRKSRKFLPGEQVTLYVEVENFRSVETDKGLHTVIGSSYRVVDEYGKQVDGQECSVVDDYCLSRRRDFHIEYGVKLPERIYEGEYRLELTLTDQLGNKIGRTSIDFEIIEPGR